MAQVFQQSLSECASVWLVSYGKDGVRSSWQIQWGLPGGRRPPEGRCSPGGGNAAGARAGGVHAALQTALSGTSEPQGLQAPIRAAAGLPAAACATAGGGCAHPGDPRILGGAQAADTDHTKPTTARPVGFAAGCRASIGCPTVWKGSHGVGEFKI